MSRAVLGCRLAVLFAALVLLASPVVAEQVAGIKFIETAYDSGTLTVDIDVTQYYDANWTTGGAPFSTAFMGGNTFFGNPIVPAIEWGDGNTEPFPGYTGGTGIPLVSSSVSIAGAPRNVYRGSFSHTYAADGDYTITVYSAITGGGPGTVSATGYDVFTGNYLAATTPTYGYVYPVLTASAEAGAGGGGPDFLEIPTAGEVGLMALALLLAGSALFLMRRA